MITPSHECDLLGEVLEEVMSTVIHTHTNPKAAFAPGSDTRRPVTHSACMQQAVRSIGAHSRIHAFLTKLSEIHSINPMPNQQNNRPSSPAVAHKPSNGEIIRDCTSSSRCTSTLARAVTCASSITNKTNTSCANLPLVEA
jgi:hypothetical protein